MSANTEMSRLDSLPTETLNKLLEMAGGAAFEPDITNPQDGDTLVYDATEGKWVNGGGGGSGGGGVLVVTSDGTVLDKTWQEINDAMPAVWVTNETGTLFNPVVTAFGGDGNYGVGVWNYQQQIASMYVAESADGYPSYTESP